MPKIVFLGTSITKGVGYGGVTAAQTFAAKIGAANGYAASDVINKGVSSDTSGGMLARLNADVIANAPAVCVVECGPNDWSMGVPLATYRANLDAIFAQLKAAGIKTVALNSSMQRGSTAQFIAYQAYLQTFENAASAAGVPVVDMYREMAASYLYYTSAQFYALYADTLHLSPTGHQFVTDIAARPRHSGIFQP